MVTRSLISYCLILSLSITCYGQQGSGEVAKPAGNVDEPVVRINTNLVQVDAVVVDEKGNYVNDLQADDFEIIENEQPQKITNFSFISVRPAAVPSQTVVAGNNVLLGTGRLKPENIRRTFALIVDNLDISYENVYRLQQALKKFIDEQMQPGDLVAILRTGGDVGSLQQFTSDKRLLYAAIERLRPSFSPITSFLATASISQDYRRAIRKKSFTVGTLGTLSTIVEGLRDLPGRKSAVIFSDGLPSFEKAANEFTVKDDIPNPTLSDDVQSAIRLLVDKANRASLVIYTVDVRGLMDTSDIPSREESLFNDIPDNLVPTTTAVNLNLANVSRFLTQQTGGFSIFNSNDLNLALGRVVNDQKGYYLLGYSPDDAVFRKTRKEQRGFFKVTVRVKRAGLKVRSRESFYGVTNEEETRVLPRTPIEQLSAAIVSPFSGEGIPLHLASLFVSESPKNAVIRSLIHIDVSNLTFVKENDGWHKAVFDVYAIAFGDNGVVVEKLGKTQTMRVRGQTYQRILQEGLISTIDFPIKKAGAYQFRVVVRDTVTARTGSANQFVEVPDVRKEKISLSSILLSSNNIFTKSKQSEAIRTSMAVQHDQQSTLNDTEVYTETVKRDFKRGSDLPYSYQIYLDEPKKRSNKQLQMEVQIRIFLDGQEVYSGPIEPLTPVQMSQSKINLSGTIKLGSDFKPGNYDLLITVTDKFDKEITVGQSVDFRVVD
ncbi:MAG: VWA domain-containing protein [Acidobacteriota bacterium]